MSPRKRASAGGGSVPLYQQTSQRLAELLDAMPVDSYLPSEPDLARQFGVSRATLREAMRTFEQQGRIRRRQGVGTVVTRPPMALVAGLEVLESLETLASRTGQSVEMGELEIEVRPAGDADAEPLGIGADAPVVQASRVILTAGRPVAFLVDVLPQDILPDGAWTGSFTGSVLDLLLRSGVDPDISRTEISAIAAAADIARRLQIQRGDVLLRLEARLYNRSGRPLDHSWSCFLPGSIHLHVVRRVGHSAGPAGGGPG